jgi:hypothetical protein
VKLVEAQNYPGAYGEYVKVVEGGAPVRFKEDFEETLGTHFVKAKDYEKAAKVLEHFVGTRAVRDLRPEVYFNLAYAHFMQKTFAKSQRFFRLFLEHEKNPVYVERARKILARIESTATRN